jgi:hypothetical protein
MAINLQRKHPMKKTSFLALFLGIFILSSCNLPNSTTPTVVGPDAIRTIAVMTIDAMSTHLADQPTATLGGPTSISTTPTIPGITVTVGPTEKPTTPSGTAGANCDQATFVRDTTIPDNTIFLPGTAFTKTWEIKNSGSCTWDTSYSLVFGDQGDAMGGAISTPLLTSGTVPGGGSTKVSVDLVAPDKPGDYKGYWKLRNPSGSAFFNAKQSMWVAIKVVAFDQKFSLVTNLCAAQWRVSTGTDTALLACPSKEGASGGYVLKTDSPLFYNRGDDEPSIIAGAQNVDGGMIYGTFPPVLVPANTEFRTFVGCAEKMDNCDVKVTLTAQVGDGQETVLKEMNQKAADFNLVAVDLDAAKLTGKSVVFRLYVRANSAPAQAKVIFLNPGISLK